MRRADRKKAKSRTDADAEFIGYQKSSWGVNVPLYNIIVKEHPLYGSTVTEATLRKYKLRIPAGPPKINIR